MPEKTENILVIKQGALGDVVLAQGPFQAIRHHHPEAKITLLTTQAFTDFVAPMGLFDEIWVDEKPKLWNFLKLGRLRDRLNKGHFDRVYDLQTSSRSSSYLALFRNPKPEWSGTASGCSHPHDNPARKSLHTIERQREQLQQAGLTEFPEPDFSKLMTDLGRFNLPARFALLVPGGSAHRPEKRWPAAQYGELAVWLTEQGLTPVLLGGAAEEDVLSVIQQACPPALNLSGKTSLAEIASLGATATVAVGNDTGPLHLIAAVGCPVTVLFSAASDPARARPRGADVTVLREENLQNLSLEKVTGTLKFSN